MLVLSRKVGQSLVIAEGVVVTVSEIGADYVRLVVEAPNEDEVRRRYPAALDTGNEATAERPIVVTISLHHATVLDRLRRRLVGDEGDPPSRDDALAALLDMTAERDEEIADEVCRSQNDRRRREKSKPNAKPGGTHAVPQHVGGRD